MSWCKLVGRYVGNSKGCCDWWTVAVGTLDIAIFYSVCELPKPSKKPACKNSTENKYLYLCYQNPVKNELVHVQKRINICICEFAFETLENVVFEILVS